MYGFLQQNYYKKSNIGLDLNKKVYKSSFYFFMFSYINVFYFTKQL